ncbi:DNA-directed RNA polymerase subunit beta [Xylanibacillus composti]|uniref:DNA-directed RNA polymerase subunit beta n=1 Tax=Xylanibacillus composti TaxID=1572762 RepID=A0A8J4M3I6_9BACL|nr:DNA-directed RNA polymerase subunit beta [Xylanibacillus composti]MDT9725967.1 DNA-directed RNA polymerase subunit beta [Xylanibacillus composti]GIQ70879.1 hypothetical protein XYCOK13_37030 [Xylanibacillus composti]
MHDHGTESRRPRQEAEQPNRSGAKPAAAGDGRPKAKASKQPPWLRITLRILRYLIVPVACVIALYVGLYVGYVTLGDQSAGDIWKPETWKHVFDLVFAKE